MNRIRTLKGTPKQLSRTGELNGFTYLMLNLPFVCNYRCTKCFNLDSDKRHMERNKHYLSLDERLNLIDQAAELGGKVVVIAGEGEPSLDKSIRDLVSHAHHKGMKSIGYSNGSMLDKEFLRFYKDHDAALVFAIDSLIPQKYNLLTRTQGLLPKVIRNIQNAIEIYGEPLLQQGLATYGIAVNTTVSHINENEVKLIRDLWAEKVYFICNPIARLGNACTHWQMFGNNETSVARHHKLIEELSETGGPLTLTCDGLCGYSVWGISVSPTGEYMTCAYTSLTNGLLGNVRKINLQEAFKRKHRLETFHYKQHGQSPCLVRAESFPSYLDTLNH